MLPIESNGTPLDTPPTKSATFVITVGTLFVKTFVVDDHSNAPYALIPVSNQYAPFAGSPVGLVVVAVS